MASPNRASVETAKKLQTAVHDYANTAFRLLEGMAQGRDYDSSTASAQDNATQPEFTV